MKRRIAEINEFKKISKLYDDVSKLQGIHMKYQRKLFKLEDQMEDCINEMKKYGIYYLSDEYGERHVKENEFGITNSDMKKIGKVKIDNKGAIKIARELKAMEEKGEKGELYRYYITELKRAFIDYIGKGRIIINIKEEKNKSVKKA